MKIITLLITIAILLTGPVGAQSPPSADKAAIEACKATGLIALQEKSPSIKDLILDLDGLVVATANANTNIEGTPVRTIIMGEAYFERKETGKSQHFLCLIGDKGKVLLTFFTTQ